MKEGGKGGEGSSTLDLIRNALSCAKEIWHATYPTGQAFYGMQ